MTEETTANASPAAAALEAAPLARRVAAVAGGVGLLLAGLFVLLWAALVSPNARVPVGEGWIDGHFYHQTSDNRATSVIGVAGLFGVAAFALALAIAQFRWARSGRRLSARWLIGAPIVVVIASCVLTITQPREYCDPSGCRETSGETH
jgi:hypothetical protein